MEKKAAPVIGISTEIDIPERIAVKRRYVDAIIRAGGIPYLLPFTDNREVLQGALALIDGLLLTGGDDIYPSLYGETILPECGTVCQDRDSYDYTLLRLAHERQLPVFGICRGMQIINTFFGGTLYQDLPSQCPSDVCHRSADASIVAQHNIRCSKDSRLFRATGKENLLISSIHHQAIKEIAAGFKVTAFSQDGIIEAIESAFASHIWGVQFHPEVQGTENDAEMQQLFRHFVMQPKGELNRMFQN